jgi:methionine-rich copper-binding protein CopC
MLSRKVIAMFKNILLAILFVLPLTANAHSPLASSSPQNGETLDAPPTEIVMLFKLPAKLIKVNLTKSLDNQGNRLLGGLFGGGDGDLITLGTSFLMNIGERHIIPLPSLENGAYSLAWRAMGEDGHVIKGDLTFKITGG